MSIFSRKPRESIARSSRPSIMTRLDRRGHGEIARWSVDDKLSQAQAKKVFKEHQLKHFTMFDISHDDGVKLTEFDPNATEILATPPMQAG